MDKKGFIEIDISKKTLDVSIYVPSEKERNYPHVKVSNDADGFKELARWIKGEGCSLKDSWFCMENTGEYGWELCLFLDRKGWSYTVVPPLAMKKAMGLVRGKDDKIDSNG